MPDLSRSSFPRPALSSCSFSHHHHLGPQGLQSGRGQLFLTVTPSSCQSPVPSSSPHLLPEHASSSPQNLPRAHCPPGQQPELSACLSGPSALRPVFPASAAPEEKVSERTSGHAFPQLSSLEGCRREAGGEVLGEGGSALTPIPAEAFSWSPAAWTRVQPDWECGEGMRAQRSLRLGVTHQGEGPGWEGG